jgi:hypothetical protein
MEQVTQSQPDDRGCIYGDTMALMADGSYKKVFNLRRGDILATGRISCVIEVIHEKWADTYCGLSAYHPVQDIDGCWKPAYETKILSKSNKYVTFWYNFILDGGKYMIIDAGMKVAVWGACPAGAEPHPYYGTQKIIDDCKMQPGYNDGLIITRLNIKSDENGYTSSIF